MKVDFGQKIVAVTGEELKNGEDVLTLRWCAVQALMALYDDERNLPGDEKLKRYTLALKIQKDTGPETALCKEVDYSLEELAKVKSLIGRHFSASVVGPCWLMLEHKEEK